MEKFAVHGTEEITNQEPAFDDLKANTFRLVDIIGGAMMKMHYALVYEIKLGGKYLQVTWLRIK